MNSPARILIVDDTAMNLKLLEGILTGHGYAVSTAASGPVALVMMGSGSRRRHDPGRYRRQQRTS